MYACTCTHTYLTNDTSLYTEEREKLHGYCNKNNKGGHFDGATGLMDRRQICDEDEDK
jgi:hypothetical protein